MNLTIDQIIEQSRMIHPDWTPADHYSYLVNDAFQDETPAAQAVMTAFGLIVWPWKPGHGDWECYRCGHLVEHLTEGLASGCPMCQSYELHLSDAARRTGLMARSEQPMDVCVECGHTRSEHEMIERQWCARCSFSASSHDPFHAFQSDPGEAPSHGEGATAISTHEIPLNP